VGEAHHRPFEGERTYTVTHSGNCRAPPSGECAPVGAQAARCACGNIAGLRPVNAKTAFRRQKCEVHILKIYDFKNREREFGRVVFALTLDRKKLAERIIIGKVDEVRRKLNGGDGDIYYEETRHLGSLLLNFESDVDGNWNKNILTLCKSYAKIFPQSARWKMIAPVQKFLTEKYNIGEPSAMFAAIRTWEDYLNFFHQNHGTDLLNSNLFTLYKPFRVYAEHKPWHDESTAALSVALQNGESAVELWYPVKKRMFETVVTSSSFLPIIFYYTHKIKEWKFVFQQCKICDAHFLARSRHYELCSDECRKKKAATAKKEFVERTKDDKLEKLHENAYQYWYNRLRMLQKGKRANVENAAAFNIKFADFRKEAKKRKSMVKRREMEFTDFENWIFQQYSEADRLMDSFIKDNN